MATKEIEDFINVFPKEFLSKCIQKIDKSQNSEKSKEDLTSTYQSIVLDIGINGLVDKLDSETHKISCVSVGLPESSSSDELAKKIASESVHNFLVNSNESLLKKLSIALRLDSGKEEDKDVEMETMKRQIEDEVMLTGMESFFRKLQEDLLKEHCKLAKLPEQGTIDELVDRLMVAIFNLEPKDEKAKKKKKGTFWSFFET